MENVVSFKQRIRDDLLVFAPLYKQTLVDHEYLICSSAFRLRTHYILSSKPDNFLHLTGLNSTLMPNEFFNKCCSGSIAEDDFDFTKPGRTEEEIKGSVRRKIKVFASLGNMFNGSPLWAEEEFCKNRVQCLIAATDKCCTLGFHGTSSLRPKTLLKGDVLNDQKAKPVQLLFRKEASIHKFHELIIGDIEAKWCRKNRYTTLTTEDVSIPKNAPVIGKKILQPDDIIKLFNCQPRMYSNVYKLGVLTGLRPGELIGLKWEDITGNELRVRRSINREDQITPGKNANAQRPIRLSKYELQVLADQKEALKRRGVISPWVFPAQDGDHAAQKFVSRSWTALCKAEGITPGVTMYGLRHTFVSMTGDMPDGLKKRRVGHSQNMDTEGIYGKHFNGDDQLEAAYIEERISTILKHSL